MEDGPATTAASGRQEAAVPELPGLRYQLQLIREIVGRDFGHGENSPQSADGQFPVERHDAADGTVWSLLPKHDMTSPLPDADEAQALQRPDCLFARRLTGGV